MKQNILLIGSGPSSYASYLRLQDSKFNIFLIDGRNLEGLNEVNCIYDTNNSNEDSRVKKFSESNLDTKFTTDKKNYPKPSLIFGGYSNIWGGAVSTKINSTKWGDSIDGLRNGYQKIIKELNIHSNGTEFENFEINLLPISDREQKLYNKLENLKIDNFHIDYSAIALENSVSENICSVCGEYIWSCKTNSSWSSSKKFKELILEQKITYIKNTVVTKVQEVSKNGLVTVELMKQGQKEIKKFNKVFVGAGAIGTSKLMLNSIENLKEVEIKSNDLITIPYLRFSKYTKKLHTFSDIFFNFKKNNLNFFGQIYGISENLFKMSVNAVPIATKLKYFVKPILRFSGGIFLYIDESISSSLILKKNNILNSGEKLSSKKLRKALFFLFKTFFKAGVLILPFLGTKKKYGNSNHYGAQFPLNNPSNQFATDSKGRLSQFNNIHIIDSSSLPYLEPGPITLTVMANSYRITDMVCNEASI